MNNQERIQKYIEEHCKNCKNKTKYDCEIRVYKKGDTVVTKCDYYER